MGNPSSGRNPVSERLLRHSLLFSMNTFEQPTMVRIYEKLMNWHLEKHNFSPEISKTMMMIVQGSVEVFKEVQNYLKPTPAKCHYIFNL